MLATSSNTFMQPITLNQLRLYAVDRQFCERPLAATLDHLGFVQADPIRAPARAQDLTLRQRVTGYRAGDDHRTRDGNGAAYHGCSGDNHCTGYHNTACDTRCARQPLLGGCS